MLLYKKCKEIVWFTNIFFLFFFVTVKARSTFSPLKKKRKKRKLYEIPLHSTCTYQTPHFYKHEIYTKEQNILKPQQDGI